MGQIPASEDRILSFGFDRMLARVSTLAGGVSSGAGARSRSALVGEFRSDLEQTLPTPLALFQIAA